MASGRDEIVIVGVAPQAGGRLDPPRAADVVLSVPSPEALAEEPEVVRQVIDCAPSGSEPLMITVEVAEALREEELRPVLDATRRARRSVVLRVMDAL